MCGIAGIYSYKKNTERYKTYLDKCVVSMKHRGPDDKGFWTNDKNYSAAFVRLSIRDLSENGHQPMISACGGYVLSFNGEIYNSDNFISALKAKGVDFRSHSDTEVLLYGLIHFGIEKVLKDFDGMFAFAFYNSKKDELILARDRVGIKPLYVGFNDDYFIYSSQYDHIINIDFIKANPLDKEAVAAYLQYGYMQAGNAIVTHTMVVPQGHYFVIDTNGYDLKKYYEFATNNIEQEDAESIFRESVNTQMISDVPVGTFLSGGVDSPLINIWAREIKAVQAFTIGNEREDYDESFYAKKYAEKIGVQQHFQTITEKDFLGLIDDNFKAFSEPFADFSSIPTLLVSKIAKNFVTVILSGDGPDELFWGYQRNVVFSKKASLFQRSKWKLALKKITSPNSVSKRYFKSTTLSSFYLQSLQTYGAEYWLPKVFKETIQYKTYGLPEKFVNPSNENDWMEMMRWLEMNIHLQRILLKVDRAAMYSSLEARVPYLSNGVLDHAASLSFKDCINDNQGKWNMKKILLKKFPEEWVLKKKQGFLVPMRDWINKEINKDVYDFILNMPEELDVLFDKKALKKMLDSHVNGWKQHNCDGFIWAVYALAKWHSIHRNSALLQ